MANNASILPDVADLARQLNGPGNTPQDDLALIQSLLGIYRKANNDMNPEGGLNYEITSAMLGDNKSRYAVLPVDLPAVSEGGELVDRWGTPYWFHPISNHLMDVRSAGPDHELWTDDDVSIPYAYHQ